MAGIYLHIPFCRKACHYCDFHFSTNLSRKADVVQAIAKEIGLQKAYLSESIETIYFGGGTPSVLSENELCLLLEAIGKHFQISAGPEITLEANPDDLTAENLAAWKASGINRLSIGIQSFHDPYLQLLNRTHTGKEAFEGVQRAQAIGLENISIDLIYGIPSEGHRMWQHDLERAMSLNVPHLSAYCLTIEEKTAFGNWARKGTFQPASEEFEIEQLERLLEVLGTHGYQQYEVSNFCKGENYSRHNTAYWQQKPYLGVGPGAHSFNGVSRQFNISNNALYLKGLMENKIPFTLDSLTKADRINEYIMIGLRTKWGIDLNYLKEQYDFNLSTAFCEQLTYLHENELANVRNNSLILSKKGMLLADQLASDFFVDKLEESTLKTPKTA